MTEAVATPAPAPAPAINDQRAVDAANDKAGLPPKYKVTVDGQETEVDLDELRRGYAHNQAASKRMSEAAAERKLAEEVLTLFKSNPKEAFKRLGADAKAFAEQVLAEEIENEMLTPEQKELRELKRFKEEMAAKEELARKEQEQQAEEAFREQVAEELQTGIISALETADLPRNEFTVSRMAFYLESCLQAGYNATPADVVNHVKTEYETEVRKLLGGFEGDKLLSFLGDDTVKKVVKGHIARTGGKKKTSTPAPVTTQKTEPEKKMGLRDFFRNR